MGFDEITQSQRFAQRDRFKRIGQRGVLPGGIRRRHQIAQEREIAAIVSKSGGGGDFFDIQRAINFVSGLGGGTIFIKNGIYNLTKDIEVKENISLIGEDNSLTILDFGNSSKRIRSPLAASETTETGLRVGYSTGTIAITSDTSAVTGTSTLWSGNVKAGDYICILGAGPIGLACLEMSKISPNLFQPIVIKF